ncbi:cytochrome ubiquinol oxidase subunit I [Gilvimarinus polysaccharolyticus]|uniref:cytochrome ubiquinol oxidase subunit I n=1 Tax=Gilvimarinus polysaccharolyticus TaxID=863921 RepID=UPI000673628A|nr:cytochrome ubiquinol oxidase subunit I [Gilvimarinus polysaccharolyticus]
MLDVFMLSRIQFAANITFHILFPTITIALCWLLLFFKLRYDRTGNTAWMAAYRFWVKIFALSFALGVVSGITMSFQFGTNWPGYMETVGNIAGPLLGYEVLTAFFLEATFLGIMLYGSNRVSNRLHTVATALVAVGTSLSAFWILALNSWMQTPAGFEMRDGVAYPLDWVAIIFNPSMPYRVTHVLLASGLTAAFLVAGISAYRLLKGDSSSEVQLTLKTGAYLAAILIPIQIFVGDIHGLNTLKHQPAKVAAMEGVWHTETAVPLQLFALPNEKTQTNDYSISIPRGASWILTHHGDGEIQGLNEFAGEHPPVMPVFWGFRIMVGVGLLMLLVSWSCSLQLWRRGKIAPLWQRALVAMTFSGWLATLAGWYVTEIGRQPFLVYGLLKTADAVTSTASGNVLFTAITYVLLYIVLIVAFLHTLFYLARKAVSNDLEPLATTAKEAKL